MAAQSYPYACANFGPLITSLLLVKRLSFSDLVQFIMKVTIFHTSQSHHMTLN